MQNYTMRTIEPILSALVDEIKRKFLTKTARTQGHSIMFSSEPFKLVPISKVADIAEKFVGNEILSPNELRSIVGFKPSKDTQADELRNRRLNQNSEEAISPPAMATNQENQNGSEDVINAEQSPEVSSDNIADMTMDEFNKMMNAANTG